MFPIFDSIWELKLFCAKDRKTCANAKQRAFHFLNRRLSTRRMLSRGAVVKAGWQLILRVVARGSRKRFPCTGERCRTLWREGGGKQATRRDARESVATATFRGTSLIAGWARSERERERAKRRDGKPGASKGKQLN